MSEEGTYVIQDEDDRYVSAKSFVLTETGWFYCYFTGDCSGFSSYSKLERAKKDVDLLQKINNNYGFNKKFCINNTSFKLINKGQIIIEKIKS